MKFKGFAAVKPPKSKEWYVFLVLKQEHKEKVRKGKMLYHIMSDCDVYDS